MEHAAVAAQELATIASSSAGRPPPPSPPPWRLLSRMQEDCLLCSSHLWSSSSASRSRSLPSSPHLLASMELSVRVEVEVAAIITSSVVAAVAVSSTPIATSSIAQSHFLTACRYSLLPLLTTRQHEGAVSGQGRRESTLICTLKEGSADDAHLLVRVAGLATVARSAHFPLA
jgi:hypothetical protein